MLRRSSHNEGHRKNSNCDLADAPELQHKGAANTTHVALLDTMLSLWLLAETSLGFSGFVKCEAGKCVKSVKCEAGLDLDLR